MPATVLLGADPPVEVSLRRSARARRISLRVSQLDGRVTLTLPKGVPEREALDFAQSREGWIRDHLAGVSDRIAVNLGASVPVEGISRRLETAPGRRVRLMPQVVQVPGVPGSVGPRLAGFLKQMARDKLAVASDDYAARLGKPYGRLTLRDTRSRWGSCSSAGNLNYAWRLILAPPEVLRYVAAHEVAHLAQMNHSPAFWRTLQDIHGPYAIPRQWLRDNGSDLHRYRFETGVGA